MTKLSMHHRPLAPHTRLLKTTAAAALLASMLLAVTAGQAAVVITSATRNIKVVNPLNGDEFRPESFALSGVFSANRLTTTNGSFASAAQNTDIQALKISGSGDVAVTAPTGPQGFVADSFLRINFDVTDVAVQFFGSVAMAEPGGQPHDNAFNLEERPNNALPIRVFTFGDNDSGSFSGTLNVGSYQLFARAIAASRDGFAVNNGANFRFDLNFLDPNVLPPPVPEPATWAMALMGLVGLVGIPKLRRRQRQQA